MTPAGDGALELAPDGAAARTKWRIMSERIVRGLQRRRRLIDGDPGLMGVTIHVKLYASSGNIRSLTFELLSEEPIDS